MATIEDTYFPTKHGKSSYTFDLQTTLQHSFSTPSYVQGFLSQDYESVKQYLTVNHFQKWLETDVIGSQEDRHLYEIIPTDHPVRPYFDIEYDGVDTMDDVLILDAVFDAIVACFLLIGIQVRPEDTSIFSASGPCASMKSGFKSSFHIILGTTEVFRNTRDHKAFVQEVLLPYIDANAELSSLLYWYNTRDVRKCMIDSAPYGSNQSFRLPFQSKQGSGRPLIPITPSRHYCIGVYCSLEDCMFIPITSVTSCLTSCLISVLPSVIKESNEFHLIKALTNIFTVEFLSDYISTRDMIWALLSKEQSPRMTELIHAVCARGSNYDYLWVARIIAAWTYSGFHTGSIVRWATQCSDEVTVKAILKQHRVNYTQELFTYHRMPMNRVMLHQRYLGDSVRFEAGIDTILLKSHLGTGKTVCIAGLIGNGPNGPYRRILIVSPRKSYTHAQHGALPVFTSYLESFHSDLAHKDRLIIQVESLHRIGSGFAPYDLVILDEIESILNQLHSIKTNAGNLITNHEVIALAVQTAGHVIMADAFLSDRTFHFSEQLRGSGVQYIENTFQPYHRQAILLQSVEKDKRIANIGGFCERIVAALCSGKKIVVVWTSKRRGDWFVEKYLAGSEYSWLFYSSTCSKEDQDGLRDVHSAWRDVQCLMMTTSITVGISYDPRIASAEFDEAFLYGASSSAMPRDIAQALFRVRSLKAEKLTYVVDTRASYDSGVRGFHNIWGELARKEDKLIREHPVVKWTTCPVWARYNFCYCENEERASRAEYKAVLEEYLVRSGYTLVEEVHVPDEKIIPFDLGSRGLVWNAIDFVDADVAEHIRMAMKRGEATAEEVLQYKKWRFCSTLKGDCSEDMLKAWWVAFYEAGQEERFWNVVTEKRLSLTEVVKGEAVKRYGIMASGAIRRRETMGRFLGMVGMHHSQESIVLDSSALDRIGLILATADKELREGLGLRASRKKGDWKVANTMELIEIVLENWGGGMVETVLRRPYVDGKQVKRYSLNINSNNTLWDNIIDITDDHSLIEF